jgi:molybdopterin-guanine dinucleotide biosynthesis protein A
MARVAVVTSSMNPLSAAILAGGRAARFDGTDKGSLIVGGRRIVERQLAALAAVADDVRIVANDASRYADLGVPIIPDLIPGAGPLGGLYTALADARHDRVLALACDLPFVSGALLERLTAESGTAEEMDAVVPRTRRGLEPLCAIYRKGCAAAARRQIDLGELRMTVFLAGLCVRELDYRSIPADIEGTLFENVNTPHDYARARDRVALDAKPFKDRITE